MVGGGGVGRGIGRYTVSFLACIICAHALTWLTTSYLQEPAAHQPHPRFHGNEHPGQINNNIETRSQMATTERSLNREVFNHIGF